jgi:hypothetical protein
MQSKFETKQSEGMRTEQVESKARLLHILGIIDFFLLLAVFAKGALFTLSYVRAHPTSLAAHGQDLRALGVNIEYVIIVMAIVVAIFGMLMQYYILTQIFKRSVDAFAWQETFFLCLCSSVLAGVIIYVCRLFFVMNFELIRIALNGLYGVLLLLLTNYFVWKKRKETPFDTKLIMKLNVLLGIYSSFIILFGTLGVKLV